LTAPGSFGIVIEQALQLKDGGKMKSLLLICLIFIGYTAQANECASKDSEIDNIEGLLTKVNPFGTWVGTHDGEDVVAVFSKKSTGAFQGKLTFGTKVYGPTGVSICDYGTSYSVIVYWQEAEVEVISKKKIKIHLPFGDGGAVELTKQ